MDTKCLITIHSSPILFIITIPFILFILTIHTCTCVLLIIGQITILAMVMVTAMDTIITEAIITTPTDIQATDLHITTKEERAETTTFLHPIQTPINLKTTAVTLITTMVAAGGIQALVVQIQEVEAAHQAAAVDLLEVGGTVGVAQHLLPPAAQEVEALVVEAPVAAAQEEDKP